MDKPSATVLELYAGRPDANQRFEVSNMLPGDSETKYFCVKAYHDADIDLFFRADVSEQTKSLGDVLHSKVTHPDTGRVLCDAPFSEIDGQEVSELLTANAEGETTAYYQIDVSLDTSEGNEYQAARLAADFEWYVEDEGGLTPPQTGDTTKLTLWITLAASSLLLILIQGLNSIRLFKRYKKGTARGDRSPAGARKGGTGGGARAAGSRTAGVAENDGGAAAAQKRVDRQGRRRPAGHPCGVSTQKREYILSLQKI